MTGPHAVLDPWLSGADPPLLTALAVLVAGADGDGRIALSSLVRGYREAVQFRHDGSTGDSPEFLETVLTRVQDRLLPSLLAQGWILDTSGAGWHQVQVSPDRWSVIAPDRAGVSRALRARVPSEAERSGSVPTVVAGTHPSVLVAEGLCKSFKRRVVVNDVSVNVAQGEVVALLGPNGAGKTTTFYLITGLIRPEQGSIRLDDRDLTTLPMYLRARAGIGYLAQEPSVFRRMTVEENVLAILETLPLDRATRQARLDALLEELGLSHLRRAKAYTLSGGERRRLELTRALVTEPKFMLLDEPFAGVDPIAVHDIQVIVAGLRQRGIGVLITDHSVEQTLEIVDRAYIMFEGSVQAAGTVRELVFNDQVADLYLGPTLTARLRARMETGE